jgi:glycosyltransferase involved in cell wall biosynthesis
MVEDQPVVLVVSRFASSANPRLSHLLQLTARGYATYLVSEKHDKPERQTAHENTIVVRRTVHPLSIIERVIGAIGRKPFRFRTFPGSAERSFNRALLRSILRFCQSNFDKKIYVIITTPPHHLALTASKLKKKFPGLHVVIDWQDIWTADEYYSIDFVSHGRLIALENEAMAAADANIFTNRMAEAYVRAAKSLTGVSVDATHAIEHAFDGGVREFAQVRRPPASVNESPIRIGFLGSFFKPPKVPGDVILEAFCRLAELDVDFELNIVGEGAFEDEAIRARFQQPWLIAEPRLDHDLAVERMRSCDWLLLFLADLPNCQNIMHMKLVSYIQIGLPILAIVAKNSYCARLIEDLQVGAVVPPGPNLHERILEALNNWEPDPNARVRIREDLCLDRFLNKWHAVISSL